MDTVRYYALEFFEENGDPRVSSYFLMQHPWWIVAASMSYLWFVKITGPGMMRDRKAYNLKRFIRFYNLFMVLANGLSFYVACRLLNYGLDTLGCRPISYENTDRHSINLIQYGWVFLMSRLVEFVDTVCFVLRKRQRQISNFHVFHHFSVPIAVWFFVKFAPGGNSGIFPILNSFIHTVMYTYYFLATFKSAHPYLGWKKYLTQIQIVQFIIIIVVSTQPLFIPGCQFPRPLLYINILFSVVFIYLFATFYIENYGKQTVRVAQNVGRRISQQVQSGVRRLSQIQSSSAPHHAQSQHTSTSHNLPGSQEQGAARSQQIKQD